ncbi:MAG: tetratricopeptide repeat protein [Candidatus Tyrphobacter sp.]
MKRLLFPFIILVAAVASVVGTTPHASARRHVSASPSPSSTPVPLPTATPEPPSIAIPRLQARIKANPQDQEAMVELAGQYLAINRPDLSLPLTQKLLQEGDKTAQVYFLDGYSQQAEGQIDNAIQDLENASTLDPTNVAVLGNLTDLYLAVNRPQDAQRVANRAITFNPTVPDAYIALGSVYSAQSHYEDARIQFEKAFALDKTSTKPLFSIAQTYVAQNNIPMALSTIDRILAVDPTSVEALVNRADLYGREHDQAHALEAYDDAAVAAPTDEQKIAIEVRKAQYLSSLHKEDQAAAIYTHLLSTYPNIALSHVAYGAFLATERHRPDQGVAEWQKALALDADNEDALRDMAEYDLQHHHATDAERYLKHLVSVAPSAQAYEMLASAYNQLHDFTDQRKACSLSFSLQRSPETLGCIGGADFELHNYHEAAQIFDVLDAAAHSYLDANPELLFVAARTYAGDHQRDKAIGTYQRLLALLPRGTDSYRQIQKALAKLNHRP